MNKKVIITVSTLLMVLSWVFALEIDTTIKNAISYVQTMFVTSNWTPTGAKNITLDGREGDITMNGKLEIKATDSSKPIIIAWKDAVANWASSIALWKWAKSAWTTSIAMWFQAETNWMSSVAMWWWAKANWMSSVALWKWAKANWKSSVALWYWTKASTDYSVIVWKGGETESDDVFVVSNNDLLFQVKKDWNIKVKGKIETEPSTEEDSWSTLVTKEYIEEFSKNYTKEYTKGYVNSAVNEVMEIETDECNWVSVGNEWVCWENEVMVGIRQSTSSHGRAFYKSKNTKVTQIKCCKMKPKIDESEMCPFAKKMKEEAEWKDK